MIIVKSKITIDNIYRLTVDLFDLMLKLWYTNILITIFKSIVYKKSLVWAAHCCLVALQHSLVLIMNYVHCTCEGREVVLLHHQS